jgi:hypothetical protein
MRLALFAIFTSALTAGAADTPTADEQTTIAAVVKLGGKADIDAKLSPDARVYAKFDGPTDAALTGLKNLTLVGGVEVFDATKCTVKSFAALKDLPHLRKLVVEKAELGPTAANAVGACKELRHLALTNCGVSDTDLAALKQLALLEYLALADNPQITDKGMATVRGFDRLRTLYLSKTSITDKGLAELKPLDALRTLSVRGTKVTPDAAEKFADDMPNLRKVAW